VVSAGAIQPSGLAVKKQAATQAAAVDIDGT
jgi:hypothetical protein